MRIALTALFLMFGLLPALPAAAQCSGTSLLDQMAAGDVAQLRADAARQPFHQGNLWQATRGEDVVTLIGTYHLDDPRHDGILQALEPVLASVRSVLVEAGPEEEAAIKAQAAKDATIFVMPDTTLPALMTPEEWAILSEAMRQRGIPGFMAAKLQPWYVSMLLSVPPCMMPSMAAGNGLDHRIITAAQARGLPIGALEPYDTVLTLFDEFSRPDQVAMLRASLAIEPQAEDYLATLADVYFAEESRLIWELMRDISLAAPGSSPETVERDLERLDTVLVTTRNRNWIPVIEKAAAQGPVLVAFGALHLPGEAGVLRLLERQGFAITRLPLP